MSYSNRSGILNCKHRQRIALPESQLKMIPISEYNSMPCFAVKVTPGASKNAILGIWQQAIKVAITAAPEKGKANQEIVRFFAKILAMKKSDIMVVQGHKSRQKVVAFAGCTSDELAARLAPILIL